MATLSPIKMVNFPAERTLADSAQEIFKKQNLSQKEVFNLFLKNIVVTGRIDLLSEEELEKQRLFKQLQEEVQQSIANYESGNFLTENEVRSRFGL